MGLFDFIKGHRNGEPESLVREWAADVQKPPKRKNPINYDPNLIAELKKEHQEIHDEIKVCLSLARENKFEQLAGVMTRMSADIKKHLARENSRLFLYVSYSEKDTPGSNVADLIREAKDTGDLLLHFFDDFTPASGFFTDIQKTRIAEALANLDTAFLSRASKEETNLFPLYYA